MAVKITKITHGTKNFNATMKNLMMRMIVTKPTIRAMIAVNSDITYLLIVMSQLFGVIPLFLHRLMGMT